MLQPMTVLLPGWRADCRLHPGDPRVDSREGGCWFLETLADYDQVNAPNMAAAEIVAREIQVAEERSRDEVVGDRGDRLDSNLARDADLVRGNLCVMPELTQWIASELAEESAVMKGRRKAREEPALTRPKKKGKEQRLARSSHAIDWASDDTTCLNELVGFNTPASSVRNASQAAALSNMESVHLSVPPPPGDPGFRGGALDALFAGPGLYPEEAPTQRPHVMSKVSWPARGNAPACLSDSPAQADSKWLGLWRGRTLRSPAAADLLRAELCPTGPYADPILKNSLLANGDCISELRQRGMARYRRAAGRGSTVGIFLGVRKSGASRFGIGACTLVASLENGERGRQICGALEMPGAPRDTAPFEGIEDLQKFLEASEAAFEQAPEVVLKGPWVTVLASKVLVDANVLELEGEAVMVAAKHVMRWPRQRAKPDSPAGVLKERRVASAPRLVVARTLAGCFSLPENLAATPGTELPRVGAAALSLQGCRGIGLSHLILELHKMTTVKLPRASRCLVAGHRGPRVAFLLRGKHLVAPKVAAGGQCSSRGLLLHDAMCELLLPCLEALEAQPLDVGSPLDFSTAEPQRQRGKTTRLLHAMAKVSEDHLNPALEKVIVGWLTSGCIVALWLGTPCAAWTRALRRLLRSSSAPFGVDGLTGAELERLRIGSATFLSSIVLINICFAADIPVFLENPRTSVTWWTGRIKYLMRAAALPEAAAETTAEPGPPTTTEAAEPEEQPLASPASLFCFSLVVPWTDEGALLELQQRRGVGIFACDGTAVYSNPGGRHGELDTRLVDIDLHCERGGLWNTMMNTPIFAKLWNTVVQDGQFKAHAWTAKTDPDTVFLPDVLKSILQSPDYPLDRAQENKGQFLNGCFIGLHGPLEVLSRRALEVYGEGNEECGQPVEEDVYIRGCLQFLGVFQQDQFDIPPWSGGWHP
ncbi:unnamed protein product [Prorocentrum cordatum]|uniref:RNA-directed RNA polymerase n=1 Tax=Prorocentrum cordatum TaxID=2364126 RepID=A0ABN9PNZ9_9DINO|nr:unnamed protein product [Polarella glacialis]